MGISVPTLSTVEIFILLGVSTAIIALRTYVRIRAVGWVGLWADDYIMLSIVLLYSSLAACTQISQVKCKGLGNDNMTDDERASLDPNGEEYYLRVLGGKTDMAARILYIIVLWLTKAAMLAFCRRLTERLGKYRTRIRIGIVLLAVTWLALFLMVIFSCRPFRKNWQINPDPGIMCYPTPSAYSVYGTLCLNIATSIYVFFVPLPILWMANIRLWKKIGLIMLVSANGFVIAIAILRAYLIISTYTSGYRQANKWAYRLCFVAVVTTNLPLLFPLLRRLMAPMMKEENSTQRGIKSITRFEHPVDHWGPRPRRPSAWNAGFLPGFSESGRLALPSIGHNMDRAMPDTGIGVGSTRHIELPEIIHREREMV